MRKCSFKKGDTVVIDFSEIHDINQEVLDTFVKFDEEHNHNHTITNIFTKNAYRDDVYYRIELDDKYMFLENEIIGK